MESGHADDEVSPGHIGGRDLVAPMCRKIQPVFGGRPCHFARHRPPTLEEPPRVDRYRTKISRGRRQEAGGHRRTAQISGANHQDLDLGLHRPFVSTSPAGAALISVHTRIGSFSGEIGFAEHP